MLAQLIGLLDFPTENFQNLQAVFFDFDGVLIDSVPLKTQAYAEIFKPCGAEAVSEIRTYHKKHGGIDRYKKIRHISDTLRLGLSEQHINQMADQFSAIVKNAIIAKPLMPGAIELFKKLESKGIKLFIVSGTPQAELQEIIKQKSLDTYFERVFGSPREKNEILNDILSQNCFAPKRCIFIGDAVGDFEAALAVGIFFLGIPASESLY